MLNVDKLKKGIVIDHIDVGKGIELYKELHLNEIEMPVVLMKGIKSEKMGKKDLIKIETDLDLDLDLIGLMNPNATVNFVKDGKLQRKVHLQLPEVVNGFLKCQNPSCISHYEDVGDINFYLVDKDRKIYRCEYCDSYTTIQG